MLFIIVDARSPHETRGLNEVYSNICMKIHISSKLTQYLINIFKMRFLICTAIPKAQIEGVIDSSLLIPLERYRPITSALPPPYMEERSDRQK